MPKNSVAVPIPAHTGTATLMFDLHNRFVLPAAIAPGLSYARHEAIVTVVKANGDVINRAAVVREFRGLTDLVRPDYWGRPTWRRQGRSTRTRRTHSVRHSCGRERGWHRGVAPPNAYALGRGRSVRDPRRSRGNREQRAGGIQARALE